MHFLVSRSDINESERDKPNAEIEMISLPRLEIKKIIYISANMANEINAIPAIMCTLF